MLIPPSTVARHWKSICCVTMVVLVMLACLSLAFGAVSIPFHELIKIPFGEASVQSELIVKELRVPRTLLAICIGAILASCGAVTQGLFRNPLADPSLIGVSAGAAAGASTVIVLLSTVQGTVAGLSLVSLGAFVGGVVAVVFVYRISTGPTGTSVATMLLAGISVTFIAAGIANVFEFFADNDMLRRMSLWRMGGLDTAAYPHLAIILVVSLFTFLILRKHYATLNALLLGESEARHLGIHVDHVKKILILVVAAGVGTSVALAGTISFVGLVVPHIVRMVVGPNHRYLMPLCACIGGIVLVLSDVIARTLLAPTELPVGLITAFIGAPVFISLLRQRHKYGMQ